MSLCRVLLIVILQYATRDPLLVNAQLAWHKVHDGKSSPAPQPRQDSGLAYDSLGNKIILFGGRGTKPLQEHDADDEDEREIFGDTWIYDISNDYWRQVPGPGGPSPRFSFVYGDSGHFFYIATGQCRQQTCSDIWRLNMQTEEWEELPHQIKPSYYSHQQWKMQHSVVPDPRYGAAGGLYANSSKLYVSMGRDNEAMWGTTFSYSLTDRGWYQESSGDNPYSLYFPHGRYQHAGAMLSEDQLLIYGGCLSGGGTGGACPARDSWIFNGRTKEWLPLDGCASPRTQASLAVLPMREGEQRAVLYGGVETGAQMLSGVAAPATQVAVFNPNTNHWSLRETQGDIPTKRAAAAMATGRSGIFMFGGFDVKEHERLYNDLYILVGHGDSADRAPQPDACGPGSFNLILVHGVLMALAFGVFLPWGVFVARYCKDRRPPWLHVHRLFQLFGALMAVLGLTCAILSVRSGHFQFAHAVVGIVTVVLVLQQPIVALFRPHVLQHGEVKTRRHKVWEVVHRLTGYCTVVLGLANVSLGLLLALSGVQLLAAWFSYVGLLLLAFVLAEVACACKVQSERHPGKWYATIRRSLSMLSSSSDRDSYAEHIYDVPLSPVDMRMKPIESMAVLR